MLLKAVADFVKRATITELDNMPYRYVNAFYHEMYLKNEYDKAHPEEAKAEAMGEALSELA